MRIAELSAVSGVSIATIKYYLREGLLSSGETTAPNQADYGQHHLDRLSLIRALREAAGLPVATIGRVVAALDDYKPGQYTEHLTIAIRGLTEPLVISEHEADEYQRAETDVNKLIEELGWDVDVDSPGHDDAVRALVGVYRYLPGLVTDTLQLHPFANAVRELANTEIPDSYDPSADPAAVLRLSVLGTALFEPVILALRKLGHVDRSRQTTQPSWSNNALKT